MKVKKPNFVVICIYCRRLRKDIKAGGPCHKAFHHCHVFGKKILQTCK